MLIIYYEKTDSGIAIITPTGEIPVLQTALSCVPPGRPFKIISDDSIPTDWTFRDAWEADFSQSDGFGADYGTGSGFGVYARDKAGNARLVALPEKGLARAISTAEAREEIAAVKVSSAGSITINIDKARDVAHSIRRQKRSEEFAPLDEVIAKQIPGTDIAGAESAREAVRKKYADMQTEIDGAESVEQLHEIIK